MAKIKSRHVILIQKQILKRFLFNGLGRDDFTSRKITSTINIIKVVTDRKVIINNVSCHKTLLNKNMKIYPVDDDRFIQSLIALKENILSEAFNWEYERVDNAVFGEFMIYCNICNEDFATTYVAHMRVEEGISIADVEKMLKINGGLTQ